MDPTRLTIEIILIIVALVAAVTDLRDGKVYNWLTYPAILVGLLLNWVLHPGGLGLVPALQGMLLAGGGLFVAYVAGGLGGGDVKLLAVAGAFVGPLIALYLLLYSFIIGGGMSLGLIVWKEGLGGLVTRLLVRPVTTSGGSTNGGTPAEDGDEELTTASKGNRLRFPFAVAVLLAVVWSFAERTSGLSLLDLVTGRPVA